MMEIKTTPLSGSSVWKKRSVQTILMESKPSLIDRVLHLFGTHWWFEVNREDMCLFPKCGIKKGRGRE